MKVSTEQDYKTRILRVLVYIQTHLDEAVELGDLAELASFSPFHFHRVFRGMVGETVMDHVRRLRLERAASQLKHTDESITSIAFHAGYETLDAFIRAFRTLFGQTPTSYRKDKCPFLPVRSPAEISFHPAGDLADFKPIHEGADQMEAKVKHIDTMKVAFVRHTGAFSDPGLPAAWNKLCSWAGPRRLLGPTTVFLAVQHDDPEVTPPERLRYDASIVLTREIEPEGEVGVQEIPAGEYVVAVHRGPYENLKDTYAALCGQWIPQHGYRLKPQQGFEIYRNHPDHTPPADLITEIHMPVEKI